MGDDGVNDVNKPYKIKNLGIGVESTKSSQSVDYNELIEIRTNCGDGTSQMVQVPCLER